MLAGDVRDRDLVVSAQTGSGKTVAFGLALSAVLLDNDQLAEPGAPEALIIAPTRELAMQVRAELEWLYAPAGGRIASCVGGWTPVTNAARSNAARTSSSARRGASLITSVVVHCNSIN